MFDTYHTILVNGFGVVPLPEGLPTAQKLQGATHTKAGKRAAQRHVGQTLETLERVLGTVADQMQALKGAIEGLQDAGEGERGKAFQVAASPGNVGTDCSSIS